MLDYFDALKLILERAPGPSGRLDAPLVAAVGRVVAEDIPSDADFPPFDKAMMDGFALRVADLCRVPVLLDVVGDIPAGSVPETEIGPGQAASIMTGAPVPPGADAVVKVEWTSGFGGKTVEIENAVGPGANISPRGEISTKGQTMVRRGTRIGVEEAALLAMVGADPVPVYPPLRAALIATGDELVPPNATPGPAQIRNCSSAALRAFFFERGIEVTDLGIVPDNRDATRTAVEKGLSCDIVVLTGGVSVGVYDFVKDVLVDFGVDVHVSKVAVKPGKPTVFGTLGEKMFFGLPGNPVSTTVIARVLMGPAVDKRLGLPPAPPELIRCTLLKDFKKKPDRLWFVPARVSLGEGATVRPIRNRGSADLPAAASANGFIMAPAGETRFAAGTLVDVVVWGKRL